MIERYISPDQQATTPIPSDNQYLNVCELFGITLQGEGHWMGHPALFLRLMGCHLNCLFCDTASIMNKGDRYSFAELIKLIDASAQTLRNGAHLVITGGSPLIQAHRLALFIRQLDQHLGFEPYIEIENDCTMRVDDLYLLNRVNCWNNSPKLSHSQIARAKRLKPQALVQMNKHTGMSWFKFVIRDDEDWQEIERQYLTPGHVSRSKIILMPCGASRQELEQHRVVVAEIAIRERVRYSDRLHVQLYDQRQGV